MLRANELRLDRVVIAAGEPAERERLAQGLEDVATRVVVVASVAEALRQVRGDLTATAVVAAPPIEKDHDDGVRLLHAVRSLDARCIRVLVVGGRTMWRSPRRTGLAHSVVQRSRPSGALGEALRAARTLLLGNGVSPRIGRWRAGIGIRLCGEHTLGVTLIEVKGQVRVIGTECFGGPRTVAALRLAFGELRDAAHRHGCAVIKAGSVVEDHEAAGIGGLLWRAARPHVIPVSTLPLGSPWHRDLRDPSVITTEVDRALAESGRDPGGSGKAWLEAGIGAWVALRLGNSELAGGVTPARIFANTPD